MSGKDKTMDEFAQLLELIRNPGEDGIPDDAYDNLSLAYTNATSTADAAATSANAQVQDLQQQLIAAKAANWDLVQMLPVAESAEPVDDGESNDDDDNSDIGDDDDFFEKEENN